MNRVVELNAFSDQELETMIKLKQAEIKAVDEACKRTEMRRQRSVETTLPPTKEPCDVRPKRDCMSKSAGRKDRQAFDRQRSRSRRRASPVTCHRASPPSSPHHDKSPLCTPPPSTATPRKTAGSSQSDSIFDKIMAVASPQSRSHRLKSWDAIALQGGEKTLHQAKDASAAQEQEKVLLKNGMTKGNAVRDYSMTKSTDQRPIRDKHRSDEENKFSSEPMTVTVPTSMEEAKSASQPIKFKAEKKVTFSDMDTSDHVNTLKRTCVDAKGNTSVSLKREREETLLKPAILPPGASAHSRDARAAVVADPTEEINLKRRPRLCGAVLNALAGFVSTNASSDVAAPMHWAPPSAPLRKKAHHVPAAASNEHVEGAELPDIVRKYVFVMDGRMQKLCIVNIGGAWSVVLNGVPMPRIRHSWRNGRAHATFSVPAPAGGMLAASFELKCLSTGAWSSALRIDGLTIPPSESCTETPRAPEGVIELGDSDGSAIEVSDSEE